MSSKAKLFVAFAGACSVFALPSTANAAAPSGVTIHHFFGGGVHGRVFSEKPQRCASRRLVKLYRQTGKKQNPRRDTKVGEDKAAGKPPRDGGHGYTWEIRYHRARSGHYYARIPAKSGCHADNSKTIRLAGRPKTDILDWSVDQDLRSAFFRYTAHRGVVPYRLRCKLDDQQYRRCSKHGNNEGSKVYKNLSPGRHVFRVYCIGADGQKDPTPAKQAFRING